MESVVGLKQNRGAVWIWVPVYALIGRAGLSSYWRTEVLYLGLIFPVGGKSL